MMVSAGGGDLAQGRAAFVGEVEETVWSNPGPGGHALERAVLAAVRERWRRGHGICRGLQVLNVACGGTLWPDICDGGFETAAHTGGTRDTDDVYHPVTMSGVEFEVTSHHHEGVRDLGEGLEVISHAEDGMVEALRHRELPWLGVQWHPERTAAGAGRSLMQEWLRSQC